MKLFLSLLPFIGSVLAMSIPRQEAKATPCVCESAFCLQSWPDSCYCTNAAKKACYDKCGGNVPVYDTCPPRDVTARASEPEPEPQPEPEPESKTPPSTCECEQTFCLQSWPDSCHCQNNAKKACFEKCGGEVPTYQACPPPSSAPVVARSEPAATTECKCTEINCTLMWPSGCYCRNYAKQLCYEECGGVRPTLDNCHNPSLTARTIEEAAEPREATKHTHQICSGGYGGDCSSSPFPPCPSGHICIRDPFKPASCGPECGEPGICVENKMCGGFMGLECAKKGQICVDRPTDDCDPHSGGADCAGVCVWPPQ